MSGDRGLRLGLGLVWLAWLAAASPLKAGCTGPIGLESGAILDAQLSASSSFDSLSTGPQHARIRTETGSGAWCPFSQINASSHEWLQVDLGRDFVLTAVETQGRFDRGRGREYALGFMVEYWRASLGRWARYTDRGGLEIVAGNQDTETAVRTELDGGVVASLVRIIPVSEFTRTVCMRIELYGCPFQADLISYSAPAAGMAEYRDLADLTYDGARDDASQLAGGLGRLVDERVAHDNFPQDRVHWVGWNKHQTGGTVRLDFQLRRAAVVRALCLQVSTDERLNARPFQRAVVSWGGCEPGARDQPGRVVHPVPHSEQGPSWVTVPVQRARCARLRLQLEMAAEADWLLIGEVRFEREPDTDTPVQTMSEDEFDVDIMGDNTFTVFSIENPADQDGAMWIVVGVVGAVVCGCGLLLLLVYCLLCISYRRYPRVPFYPNVKLQNGAKRSQPLSPYQANRYDPDVHIDKFPPVYGGSEDNGEYAEPDCNNLEEPLIKTLKAWHSLERASPYASSAVGRETRNPAYSATSPLSAFERFAPAPAADLQLAEYSAEALQQVRPVGECALFRLETGQWGALRLFVKTPAYERDPAAAEGLRRELRVLGQLQHQNVLGLRGTARLRGREPSAVFECGACQALGVYLQSGAATSADSLLSLGTQIAAGMAYLESHQLVHRDLAARNCLVDADGTLKLAWDLGMVTAPSDYAERAGCGLPLRWMAPELLRSGRFTHKSDVWAMGVTLWELFERCGARPLAQFEDRQVAELVMGLMDEQMASLLARPDECSPLLYDEIFRICWTLDPDQRPALAEVHRLMQNTFRRLVTCTVE